MTIKSFIFIFYKKKFEVEHTTNTCLKCKVQMHVKPRKAQWISCY
jgi:hypothetical protein